MLGSLRKALADYAASAPEGDIGDPIEPIEVRITALIEAIEAAEKHLSDAGFDMTRLKRRIGIRQD